MIVFLQIVFRCECGVMLFVAAYLSGRGVAAPAPGSGRYVVRISDIGDGERGERRSEIGMVAGGESRREGGGGGNASFEGERREGEVRGPVEARVEEDRRRGEGRREGRGSGGEEFGIREKEEGRMGKRGRLGADRIRIEVDEERIGGEDRREEGRIEGGSRIGGGGDRIRREEERGRIGGDRIRREEEENRRGEGIVGEGGRIEEEENRREEGIVGEGGRIGGERIKREEEEGRIGGDRIRREEEEDRREERRFGGRMGGERVRREEEEDRRVGIRREERRIGGREGEGVRKGEERSRRGEDARREVKRVGVRRGNEERRGEGDGKREHPSLLRRKEHRFSPHSRRDYRHSSLNYNMPLLASPVHSRTTLSHYSPPPLVPATATVTATVTALTVTSPVHLSPPLPQLSSKKIVQVDLRLSDEDDEADTSAPVIPNPAARSPSPDLATKGKENSSRRRIKIIDPGDDPATMRKQTRPSKFVTKKDRILKELFENK